jgi:hypothetical protein
LELRRAALDQLEDHVSNPQLRVRFERSFFHPLAIDQGPVRGA